MTCSDSREVEKEMSQKAENGAGSNGLLAWYGFPGCFVSYENRVAEGFIHPDDDWLPHSA